MRRPSAALTLCAVLLAGTACGNDRVELRRGALGPATYEVSLRVSGRAALRSEKVEASLRVEALPDGANLHLRVMDEDPIVAEVKRDPSGRLILDTVQRVPPSSAGEADLASLVSQLDPPLPGRPVRLGQRWSSSRKITTETLQAELRSDLRIIRFRRIAGLDAAEIRGEVTGSVRAQGAAGVLEGVVTGRTTMLWAIAAGRVASSSTGLAWSIPDVGRVVVETSVRPG